MRHPLFSDQKTLEKHIVLPELPATVSDQPLKQKVALITGATGFIGGYLLKELIANNTFESYVCIVRKHESLDSFQRVKHNLLQKGTPEHLISTDSITTITGDILQPRFGLTEDAFMALAEQADHFFHFAASMHWVSPFNKDTLANIAALKTSIQFCALGKPTLLHYASSMGMWALLNHHQPDIYEQDIHDQGDELAGGYFQSKWINEKTLALAKDAGINVNIYRIGDVKGNSENGQGDPQNFINMFMKYFIEKGISIDRDIPELNFIPVDYLVKAITHIATSCTNQTFQFSSPELISFSDIHQAAIEVGFEVKAVKKEAWLKTLRSDNSTLSKLLKPIFKPFSPDLNVPPTTFDQIGVDLFTKKHDTTNTTKALSGSGIHCPNMLSDGVLKKYLIHLGKELHH